MSEPTCIDLQERFGRRYRVGWESDGATRSQWPRADWLWLMELRCRYGVVYPVGGEILAAVTDRRGVASKLRALPCVLTARGDVETVVTFHVGDVGQVLGLLKPYRRRHVSDAERDRLRRIGFGPFRHSESEPDGLETTTGNENDAGGAWSVRGKPVSSWPLCTKIPRPRSPNVGTVRAQQRRKPLYDKSASKGHRIGHQPMLPITEGPADERSGRTRIQARFR